MKYLLGTLFLILNLCAFSQHHNGYIYSDFSGIIGARTNPSIIANSPYKYDFNLLNGNMYFANNISSLSKNEEGEFRFKRLINDQEKFLASDFRLGALSGFMSLKNKSSLGFQYQFRGIATGIDISPEFAEHFRQLNNEDFANSIINDQQGDFAFSAWHEFALTYALVLVEDPYKRWKLGANLKLINPLGNMIAKIEDIDYIIDPNGLTIISNFEARVAYSSNLNEYSAFDGNEPFSSPDPLGLRPSFDIGFTYEKVLDRDDPRTKINTSYYPDILYESRLSVAITDIGRMQYDYGSASFQVVDVLPITSPIDTDELLSGISSVRELRDSLETILEIEDISGSYTVSLPTALNINYDYNWKKNWFFNVATQLDLSNAMNTDYRINYHNSVTVTARHETGKRGYYIPLHYNFEGSLELGFAARFGPLTIGTQSVRSVFRANKKTLGAFFSININQLKANSNRPYCFGRTYKGTSHTRRERKPAYLRN